MVCLQKNRHFVLSGIHRVEREERVLVPIKTKMVVPVFEADFFQRYASDEKCDLA